MGLIGGSVPSMVQGMSQQAPELRMPTQGDLQVNGFSDPVYGLGKRTGTDHIHKLSGLNISNGLWASWVSRDAFEKYAVLFDGTTVRVFGLDGYEYLVNAAPSTLPYLNSPDSRRDLMSLTLADTTLVLNRSFTVAMSSTAATVAITDLAIVFVKQGNYGQDYSVTFGGSTYTYTSSSTDVAALATNIIAAGLVAVIGSPSGYTIAHTSGDSHFTVRKTDNSAFDIDVRDSVANAVLGVVKNAAAAFDELPPIAPNGYVCQIVGSADSENDDYWVKYDATTKPGAWVECVAPGTQIRLNAATMPHKLDRLQDDENGTYTGVPFGIYFQFSAVDWEDRVCGDITSVPNPSIVGRNITSMFLFQNRLGLLLRDRFVMSKTADYFNLWRQTAVRVLDNDTIDITVAVGRLSDDRVLDLRFALSFAEQLLLIGDRAQVVISSSEALTPTSIRAALATSLETDEGCPPISMLGNALIPFTDGLLTGLREYFLVPGSDRVKDSDLLTKPVPRLLQGSPVHLSICTATSTVLISTSAEPTLIYVYRWTIQNDQKVQAAWSWWDFGHPVLAFEVLGSTLWLIVNRPDGPCLESMELPPWNKTEVEAPFPILLDRKTPCGTANPLGHVSTRAGGSSLVVGGSPGGLGGGGGPPPPPPPPPPTGDGGGGSPATAAAGEDDSAAYIQYSQSGSNANTSRTSTSITPSYRERALVSYSTDTDLSQIILPWIPDDNTVVVRADTMQALEWEIGNGPTAILVRGDRTQQPLYIGRTYEFRYRFGPAIVSKPNYTTGGAAVLRAGRLQISRWQVTATDTGPFDMEVRVSERSLRSKRIVPKRVGGSHSTELRPILGSVLVLARADRARVDIVSTSHWPSWFLSAEWSGEYNRNDSPI